MHPTRTTPPPSYTHCITITDSQHKHKTMATSDALNDLLKSMKSQVESNLWKSFRLHVYADPRTRSQQAAGCNNAAHDRPASSLSNAEKMDLAQWATRINRREVFSKSYIPSVGETEEVIALKRELSQDEKDQDLFPPQSIILKRSPVLLEPSISKLTGRKLGMGSPGSVHDLSFLVQQHECPERELILLSNEFCIATLTWSDGIHDGGSGEIVSKRMVSYEKLTNIVAVVNLDVCSASSRKQDTDALDLDQFDLEEQYKAFHDTDERAFRIVTKTGSYTFICSTPTHKATWISALQHAVVGAYLRMDSHLGYDGRKPGWQHRLIRKDVYSAAVCNDVDMLHRCLQGANSASINKGDSSGYTALHYAAMYGNDECLTVLLDAGADPNALDIFNKTPLHRAMQHPTKAEKMKSLILANGGDESILDPSMGYDDGDLCANKRIKSSWWGLGAYFFS
uniref:PH domain-containing protein n=1 Tax=Leptocylindrus danicus TaxID=163516 RepID=A0A7S2K781_9STRA|mmetsp:Transcript_19163/g.28539  ORF Transcript_19163/g.28539 Transcript_19163/m.28539 type:complete len:454 (+) Transcript_19163:42-1403(+)